jgi:RHS repeat-associated protein
VQNSYSYDAFGNTTSYSEKVGNKFRYAGEQYDSITGEYYLRARYYDPAMGRFMNEDTYKGQIDNPQSMNLYAYCINNPVIYIDPSGHYVAEQDNSKKCSSGNSTKDTTRAIAEYIIANPVAVNITQHPDWVTEQLFYAFGFKRDDSTGVYHARQDALQQYGGYNFLYDIVFDYATSMAAQPFEFTYNGQSYRFWAWKGDYLNLGAGAELGLYKRLSVYGIQKPHWLVDTSLALPMTLTLKDNKGNLIASYHPSEPQWWITAFNPNKQNVNAKDLRVTYTIDFSGNKKSKGMFKAFYKRWYRQDRRLTFYRKNIKSHLDFREDFP